MEFDLALLDIGLPGISGLEVLVAQREDVRSYRLPGQNRDLPVATVDGRPELGRDAA
jgi:CheY-like chemotaxis protein